MRTELYVARGILAGRTSTDRNAPLNLDVELALQDARRARRGHHRRG